MRTRVGVGIHGWGVYIPRYRIKVEEIARVWGYDVSYYVKSLMLKEKAVAGIDEDVATIAVEATKNALKRANIDGSKVGAVYVGTESKPYAVKPTATIVAEAIGATPHVLAADIEFACKAGTEAFQICTGLVASGMVEYALAIGADTAQANPGDHLEFSAASGGAAYVLGPDDSRAVASIEGSISYVTDTPDFWRRELSPYPKHAEAFTGDPAYFRHVVNAARELMNQLGLKTSDINYVVFHQPNGVFPLRAAAMLGIPKEKVLPSLLAPEIGNTYAASSLIGLAAVLDIAKPGERILVVSYGSGAGSDAISLLVKDGIEERKNLAPTVRDYVNDKTYIDYGLYARFRRIIRYVR